MTCPIDLYVSTLFSPNSIQSCISRLNSFTKKHGSNCKDYDWKNLRYADVVKHLSEVIISGKSYATANQNLAFLKGVAKQSWLIGLITTEEYQRINSIRKFKGHRLPTGQALSKGQVHELFYACENDQNKARGLRDAVVLSLGFHMALRRSEIGKVKVEDLDLDNLTIRVIGKGNKEAELPLSNQCASHIKNWLSFRADVVKKNPI